MIFHSKILNNNYLFGFIYLLTVISILQFQFIPSLIIILYLILNITWVLLWEKRNKINNTFFALFIFFNLTLVFSTPPFFESDFYRYFIDGLHSLEQQPIYSIRPEDSLLSIKYPKAWELSQYNQYGSIYPGVAVYFFKWLTLLANKNIETFTLLLKLSSLIFGVMIAALIANDKYFKNYVKEVILFTFNPLFILEWYINLHYDFLLAFAIVVFVFSKNHIIKKLSLWLGFHIKYLIVLFIPTSQFKLNSKKEMIKFLVIGFLCLFFYQSFDEILAMIKNLIFFGKEWEMNAGTFRITTVVLSKITSNNNSISLSFIIQIAILICGYVIIKKKFGEINKDNFWLMILLFIITSPVVNPWYFTWILPLVVKSEIQGRLKYFMITPIYLSYFYYTTDSYQYVFYLEHILFWILFILLLKYQKLSRSFFLDKRDII